MVRRVASLLAVLLFLGACGASDPEPAPSAAAVAAADNATSLDFTGELATTEMLDVRTGAVTSLDDVVTGDRAVVLWYWAPD